MKVRCWVLLGDSNAARQGMLLPVEPMMTYSGGLPNAADYEPGQFVIWAPAVGMPTVALVCVDIPLP